MSLVTPGAGHFSPPGHNLNKLGRGPLGDAIIPNIKAQCHMVSDKKIFSCFFPKEAYVKHVTPGAGHFWPQGYNLNKLSISSLGDASYQISRLKALWFQTRRFFSFFSLYKHMYTIRPQVGTFWLQGHNLNKLGRCPLGDATYQISMLYVIWFQTRHGANYFGKKCIELALLAKNVH